jgi:hypothetical protein
MRKALVAAVLVMAQVPAWASPVCERPEEAAALHTAALQQELMVAAFLCHDIAAYNDFVLSHQAALQESDRALMAYFERQSPVAAFDAYNLYKTELANASSLRRAQDRRFCTRADANFRAAVGRPLAQLLGQVPYPVDTGSVRCAWTTTVATTVAATPPPKRIRHRTWLGRLVDAIFH